MRPSYPHEAPAFGGSLFLDERIEWLRLPLPMALDHINIYILHDEDGVTIVDTGFATNKLREMWRLVLERINKPVKRVLVTHYHPDHIGLAAWFVCEYGAELYTSRLSYTLAKMLQLDRHDEVRPEQIDYWKRAGYDQEWIGKRAAQRPFQFLDSTELLPLGMRSLLEGEVFEAAGRSWHVRMGQGHAADHLTLWSEDFVLIGDQCLPAITPVIAVYPTEPYADQLGEFTKSCAHLAKFANDQALFLPGHNRPFFGGKSRLLALAHHHEKALDRLREALKEPVTMRSCYPLLFKRKITADLEGFAIAEATAHFNYLWLRGEIQIVATEPLTLWQCS